MKKILAKLSLLGLVGLSYIGLTGGCTVNVKAEAESQLPPSVVSPVFPEGSYDNSTHKVSEESLEDMLDNAYKVEANAVYLNRLEGRNEIFRGVGTCFLAEVKDGKQYFVTCHHVVEFDESFYDYDSGNFYDLQSIDIKIVNDEGKKYDVNILSQNEKTDMAVLSPKEDLDAEESLKLLRLDYKIDFADLELKQGDVMYAVGFPLNVGKFLSQGIITYLDNYRDVDVIFESGALNPGNSGGPLYVIKDGIPYIAGIGQFYIFGTQGMFGAVHHKYAQEEVEKAINNPQTQPQTKPEDNPDEPDEGDFKDKKSKKFFPKKKLPYITRESEKKEQSSADPKYKEEKRPYITRDKK